MSDLKKWEPVVSAMKVKDEYKKLVAKYLQHHVDITINSSISIPKTYDDNDTRTLTMSASILKRLLENNIKVKISEKPLDLVLMVTIRNVDDFFCAEQFDSHIMDEVTKIILEKIPNNQKLKIYKLIDRIDVDNTKREVRCFSNILLNSRERKLNRILTIK